MNKKKNRHKWDKKELKAAYLFTLPSFIGFMCFVLIPIIWVIVISFHKYNVFTGASTFVGMENYKKIFVKRNYNYPYNRNKHKTHKANK